MAWVTAVTDACALGVRGFVAQLSVAPLPTKFDPSTGLPPQRYLNSLVAGVRDAHLGRRIAEERADTDGPAVDEPVGHGPTAVAPIVPNKEA